MSVRSLLGSRFLRDSTTLQVGAMSLAVGNLGGVVALSHVLGAHKQGEFVLAISIYSFLWFLTGLGLNTVVIRHVARTTEEQRPELVAGWLAQLGKVTAFMALATSVFAWLVLPAPVSAWFGDKVDDPGRVARNAALLCAIPLLEVPRMVSLAGLAGTRRMASIARVENGQEACRVLLVVVGALVAGTARGPVVGMLIASLLGSLLGLEAWIREARAGHLPGPRAVLRARSVLPWRAGVREGIQMGLVRNINIYASQILPMLILGRFGAPAWVAYLRMAQRFTDVPRMLMGGIGRTALPVLSNLSVESDGRRFRKLYGRASMLSGATVGAGLVGMLLLAPAVIDSLLPRDYARPVRVCLWILTPGVFVFGFSVVNDTFYLLTEKLRVGIALSLLGLFVNTAVVLLLANLIPGVGVAYGLSFTFAWSFVHVLYALWWFRRRRIRELGVPAAPAGADC